MTAAAKEMGKRIRLIRKEMGMTQEELGAALGGVAPNNISRYEKGRVSPPMDYLSRLSERSGYSLDYIIRGRHRPLYEAREEATREDRVAEGMRTLEGDEQERVHDLLAAYPNLQRLLLRIFEKGNRQREHLDRVAFMVNQIMDGRRRR